MQRIATSGFECEPRAGARGQLCARRTLWPARRCEPAGRRWVCRPPALRAPPRSSPARPGRPRARRESNRHAAPGSARRGNRRWRQRRRQCVRAARRASRAGMRSRKPPRFGDRLARCSTSPGRVRDGRRRPAPRRSTRIPVPRQRLRPRRAARSRRARRESLRAPGAPMRAAGVRRRHGVLRADTVSSSASAAANSWRYCSTCAYRRRSAAPAPGFWRRGASTASARPKYRRLAQRSRALHEGGGERDAGRCRRSGLHARLRAAAAILVGQRLANVGHHEVRIGRHEPIGSRRDLRVAAATASSTNRRAGPPITLLPRRSAARRSPDRRHPG